MAIFGSKSKKREVIIATLQNNEEKLKKLHKQGMDVNERSEVYYDASVKRTSVITFRLRDIIYNLIISQIGRQ